MKGTEVTETDDADVECHEVLPVDAGERVKSKE
jgi:hypothetical protein